MENLVIQTAYLGDLVLSIPLMRQLVQIDPEHHLAVVCRRGLGDLIRATGLADRVIEVDKKNPAAWKAQKRELLSTRFHHIVCPHESPRTAFLVARMKASGLKIGFHRPWNFFAFDRRVKKPMHLPDALRQLSLLTSLSHGFAEEFSEIGGMTELWNSSELGGPVNFFGSTIPIWARLRTSPRPRPEGRRIFLAPGSAWATKRWTLEGYTGLAGMLLREGWEVVLVGSPDEKPLADTIERAHRQVKNQVGKWSISQTVREFETGQALVANDSGAIHMAALAGLPTVAIFGPTTLAFGFRPWQENAIVVQRRLKCRPCGKHGHQKCPIGTHECMTQISVNDVRSALAELLAAKV
jgi:heptosyltransferase-2